MTNYAEADQLKGAMWLDTFIDWVNADHSDAITLNRNQACYMRDEIIRLRKVEKELSK